MANPKKNTPEQKEKANNSRNAYRKVISPEGEFKSIKEAALHHKISPPCIRRYCEVGKQQRELGKVDINQWQKNDYREWYWGEYDEKEKYSAKRVRTPFGEFNSCKAAADAEGITPPALSHKLKRSKPGYEYL